MNRNLKAFLYVFPTVAIIILSSCKPEEKVIELELVKEKVYGAEDGSLDEIFGSVRFMAVDKYENVYALDTPFKVVKKFSVDGKLMKVFGNGEGDGPGEFRSPRSIAVDEQLNLYVCDLKHHSIVVFDSTGAVIRMQKFNNMYGDVAAVSLSEVFVLRLRYEADKKLIHKYDFTKENIEESHTEFDEVYSDNNNLKLYNSANTGRIFFAKNSLFHTFPYPYIINQYSLSGELLNSYKREVAFFESPKLKHEPRGQWYHFPSMVIESGVLNDSLLVNYILHTENEGDEYYTQYLDLWSLNTDKYLGISKLGQRNLAISIECNGKYLYANAVEPYPSVIKYVVKIVENHP
ncbi:MAG: 6-bladed beta-propeller [Melioribacteraceae bacterium]|nr:6-bladed beta-propeller [Melioribacteraceae bacterium]MCF8264913.1 6-bladed beta-propeller [Melioribacteraceae bacterium]MCF8430727.1 6-bladed beta-propeller [Melioribacteraceae bacterium]